MKGLILAAGYGTRNLPLTKTLPKELLPLYDKPIIDFILEECLAAEITELIILTNKRKKNLEDYFDRDFELEDLLKKQEKKSILDSINISNKFKISFVRQTKAMGTGHALLSVKHLIQNEPLAVFFPDDIIFDAENGMKELIKLHKQTGYSILGVREEKINPSLYGVVECFEEQELNYVNRIVEKPKSSEIRSNLVSVGRFIYTPEFFDILQNEYQKHKSDSEFYPMSSMMQLAKEKKLLCQKFKANVFDTGNHEGYFQTFLEYALTNLSCQTIIKESQKIQDLFCDKN